jgi:hypothetical protein
MRKPLLPAACNALLPVHKCSSVGWEKADLSACRSAWLTPGHSTPDGTGSRAAQAGAG